MRRFIKKFLETKIREADNGISEEAADDIVQMREYSFATVNRIMWGTISTLALIAGFFIVHWFNGIEEYHKNEDAKFAEILKDSKEYADTLMAQHVKDAKLYWDGFSDVKKTVAETHDQVERITNFMEFKFGMPEKKIRKK